MALTECGNGHVYDTELYASCPYCSGGHTVIDFSGGSSQESGGFSSGGKTTMPAGGHSGGSDDYGKTVMPGGWNGSGSPDWDSRTVFGQMNPNTETSDYGETVMPGGWNKKDAEEIGKTVGAFTKKYAFDPVTGWLVCVNGPGKGNDYHLKAKINTIGRSTGNDICLRADDTISRENHARLAYDPRHSIFTLIPGEGSNTVYLNDMPVYMPLQLHAYDRIEIGESTLLFVPLCCDQFSWFDDQKDGNA